MEISLERLADNLPGRPLTMFSVWQFPVGGGGGVAQYQGKRTAGVNCKLDSICRIALSYETLVPGGGKASAC